MVGTVDLETTLTIFSVIYCRILEILRPNIYKMQQ